MNRKLPKIILIVVLVGIVGDLAYLHWQISRSSPETSVIQKVDRGVEEQVLADQESAMGCEETCLSLVQNEVARAVATISAETIVEKTTETVVEKTTQVVTSPQISYLPLGGGGSTTNQNWTEVSGSRFVFDLDDYTGTVSVIWEANLRAEHANSKCYARVYDVSNLRGVDYSEQTTASTSSVNLASLPLSIWQGKNDYYLEAKSLNGVRCYLESPRLKIVTQ